MTYRPALVPPTGHYLRSRCACSDRPQGSIQLLVSGTIPDRTVSINQWRIPLDDGEGDIWVPFITVLIEHLHAGTIRQ